MTRTSSARRSRSPRSAGRLPTHSGIYRDFGFDDVRIKFSDRPQKRIGSDAIWDKSEAALKAAVEATGLAYTTNPGEGAFYGPKLEFVLRDAIGRDWQCGTLQVDLNLPERLAPSTSVPMARSTPVMLHRALFGSLERFTGILLEHYAGKLPLWLAPVQAVVATITSDGDSYADEVAANSRLGLRIETDLRNEKIGYKIREHSLAKVPVLLVVGKREAKEGTVSLRRSAARTPKPSHSAGAERRLQNRGAARRKRPCGSTDRGPACTKHLAEAMAR